MSLPVDLVARLETALLDAFPDDDALDRLMRRVGMQARVPGRAALAARVGNLVEVVDAQGCVRDLLDAALDLAPGNLVLEQARQVVLARLDVVVEQVQGNTVLAETASRITASEQRDDVLRRRGRLRAARVVAVVVVLAVALIGYRLSDQHPASSVASGGVDPCVRANPLSDAALADTGLAGERPGDFRCPSGMVPVPAGKFCMGSPDAVGNPDEHPQHEVTLSAYCIDRTEVTVKAYTACVAAGRCTRAHLTVKWNRPPLDDMVRYNRLCNRDDKPDYPMNCVDWDQADAYCRKQAHARLPTEAEWEYAARGPRGLTYPWGSNRPSEERLNACGPECVEMVRRDLHQDSKTPYIASDPYPATAPVGRFPDGASPFKALDMAGNVWEWTADVYDRYERTAVQNPRGPTGINPHVFRGGSWWDVNHVYFRAAHRNKAESWERYDNLGFRCAR